MARDMTQLHPRLQGLARQLVAEAGKKGLIVKITDCVRDAAEQADCVARKTSSLHYPWSHHNWGTAFDICRNDGKGAYNDTDGWFTKVGRIGERLGLEWGGSWRNPVDKPHFQLPDWGTGCGMLVKTYGTPETFKRTWNVAVVSLVTDGLWSVQTTRRLQQIFKTTVDGKVSQQAAEWQRPNPGITGSFEWVTNPKTGGSDLIRAMQIKFGVEADGFIGPNTIAAMQKWFGMEPDGCLWYPSSTIRALQTWCNEQK